MPSQIDKHSLKAGTHPLGITNQHYSFTHSLGSSHQTKPKPSSSMIYKTKIPIHSKDIKEMLQKRRRKINICANNTGSHLARQMYIVIIEYKQSGILFSNQRENSVLKKKSLQWLDHLGSLVFSTVYIVDRYVINTNWINDITVFDQHTL